MEDIEKTGIQEDRGCEDAPDAAEERKEGQGDGGSAPDEAREAVECEAEIVEDGAAGDKAKRRKRLIIAAIIAAAVIIIAAAVCVWAFVINSPYESAAIQGYYEGKTEEQIQQELNEKLEEGMMNVSMKASLYASPGQKDNIEIRWENIAANTMDQDLTIYPADDPNDILYKSKLISPGEYVQYVDFAHGFEAGTYTLIGMMGGYDRDTHKLIGNAGVEVTLYVS